MLTGFEEVLARVLEQSIVSGGFLFLLWHVVQQQDKRMQEIVKVLDSMNKSLNVLSKRVENLEKGEK